MAGNSEIIAILSSGVSFRRLLRPYMIGAAVIAALTFVLSNYLIPPTNVRRIDYTNKYVRNKRVDTGVNIQLQVKPGVVAYFGRFDKHQQDRLPILARQVRGKEADVKADGADNHLRFHTPLPMAAARLYDTRFQRYA